MAIVRTADLGWTAGQNVSSVFPAQIASMSAGDVLVLDHMYDIAGSSIQFPDNFTLAAGAAGAGLNVTDTASNSNETILLGNGNTLLDLTVTCSNAPNTGYDGNNPVLGTDFHEGYVFVSVGRDNLVFRNCDFSGNIRSVTDVRGGNDPLWEDCRYTGGYYQVRIGGDIRRPIWRRTLFRDGLVDGIKTLKSGGTSRLEDGIIEDCVFIRARDGIDLTGGFRNSFIRRNYFVHHSVTAIDAKILYDNASDRSLAFSILEGLSITDNDIINSGTGALVVTTLDNGSVLTNTALWDQYAAQQITFAGSNVVENTNTQYNKRLGLMKDCRLVSFGTAGTPVQTYGLMNTSEMVRELQNYAGSGMPKEITIFWANSPNRTAQPDSYYEGLAGIDHSSLTYGDGSAPSPKNIGGRVNLNVSVLT